MALIYICFSPIFYYFFLLADKNELLAARNFLEQAAATNLAGFLKALSTVLANPANSQVSRQAAGLQIKNHLTSKDAAIKEQYQQRWLSFPTDDREYVKKNVSFFSL